jgi:hypothetical protein
MQRLAVIAVQIVIALVLAALLEGGARVYETFHPRPTTELQLAVQTYLTFAGAGVHGYGGFVWRDTIRGRDIPSTMRLNNYASPAGFDFEIAPDAAYLDRHARHPGEHLVIITGASVVVSAGAARDETTISARLEHHLNTKSGERWRVLNMAVGSWIAYQQFVGLSLFAKPLDPDWIVVMDGANDGAAPCLHGSGPANPMEWPKLLYLTYGGSGVAPSPLLRLARHSAAVRLVTGLRRDNEVDDPRRLAVDDTEADPRFRIKLAGITAAVQDRQVAFYLQAERNILALFQHANVLLSTQPMLADNAASPAYRRAFAPNGTREDLAALVADLDRFMAAHRGERCNHRQEIDGPGLVGYFMGRSAMALRDLAASAQAEQPARRVLYRNVEAVLPYEPEARAEFFIDYAHMTEAGLDRVAEFFADTILAAR